MWSILPFLLFQAMRNFLSALERPRWIFIVSALGIVLNAIVSWSLIFGRFGLPALGIFGGGLGSSIVWTCLTLVLGIVIARDRKFRRFHLFGRWWRADWPRFRHIWRLGLPIGMTMAFEGAVFGAAAYLMGLIDADFDRRPRGRAADRRIELHGPPGPGPGGDGPGRPGGRRATTPMASRAPAGRRGRWASGSWRRWRCCCGSSRAS